VCVDGVQGVDLNARIASSTKLGLSLCKLQRLFQSSRTHLRVGNAAAAMHCPTALK